ncbi:diacylglycerol kinase family lipid kinase [Ginsengibacter hankyongi]|uniref:Diacylglycerol kinase family lipid kinase n=1 Tax=Ginsengibacter hankyongi TaxID=2607284 RepID=A0A5J5IR92_9BACT|nr:diacylglycerol kinase family protein [Ginsengibacter hankyongi]KAA9042072.1 diacylglycerol kinase family lipid kinase [Ginsengibacter hankyongi]
MRNILFFINPISGTRNKLQLEKKIVQKCEEHNIGFKILFTAADGNYSFLREQIKQDKVTDVVICGGDGTLSPVISSLLNVKVNIGIIPTGSGNGLAFTAKIPRSVDKALEIIFKGKTSCVDSFLINGKLSCMLCGIGLDAQVAYDFSLQKKRGLSTYIKQTFKNFLAATPYHFELKVRDTTFKVDAFFICIANSNQFGNNFTIAPEASLNDGLLDIIVVKKMSKLRIIWSVFKQMKTGKIITFEEKNFHKKNILYFQTGSLQIINPEMAPLHIDGDHAPTAKKFDIEILPSAFTLIRP